MKRISILALLLSAAALLLAGCAIPSQTSSHGAAKIMDETTLAQIEKGKSTKADVEKLLGKPGMVDFTDAGFEKWVYTHVASTVHGSAFNMKHDLRTDTLTVLFTKEGIVENLGKGESGGGSGPTADPAKAKAASPYP